MADLEGKYSAVLPVPPKAATEKILDVAGYPKWWSRTVTTSLAKGSGGKAFWAFTPEKKGTRVTFNVSLNADGIMVKMLGKAVDVGAIHEKVISSSLERLAESLAG